MSNSPDLFGALTAEEHNEKAPKRNNSHIFTAVLFLIFIVVLLMAIMAGTNVYRGLSGIRSATNESRLGVSLISNMVKANDAVDAVATGEGPEGHSLVLREVLESGTYETRIYLYQDYIVEEYTLEGSPYTPERATQIVASKTFDFAYADGVLSVQCDQGTSRVALRSLLGGA